MFGVQSRGELLKGRYTSQLRQGALGVWNLGLGEGLPTKAYEVTALWHGAFGLVAELAALMASSEV